MLNDSLIDSLFPRDLQNNNITPWQKVVSVNKNKGAQGPIMADSDILKRQKWSKVRLYFIKQCNICCVL